MSLYFHQHPYSSQPKYSNTHISACHCRRHRYHYVKNYYLLNLVDVAFLYEIINLRIDCLSLVELIYFKTLGAFAHLRT